MNKRRMFIFVISIFIIISILGISEVHDYFFDFVVDKNNVYIKYNVPRKGTIKVVDTSRKQIVYKNSINSLSGIEYLNSLSKNKAYKCSFYDLEKKEIYRVEKFIYNYDMISKLPIISLNTEENKIPKADVLYPEDPLSCWGYTTINNTKVEGIMDMYKDGDLAYSSKMSFRIRGNTSSAGVRKPSYKLELKQSMDLLFRTTSDYKSKEWYLLNCGNNINTVIASLLAQQINRGWAPKFEMVSLLINNDYRGTYLLYEKVKSPDRMEIKNSGFLIENDPYWWKPDTEFFRMENQMLPMAYTYIKPKFDEDDKIYEYMELIDSKIESRDKDLFDYLDIDSAVDWILSQDIILQEDYAGSNLFLYREDNKSLLKFGPSWDFDLTLTSENPNQFAGIHNIDVSVFFPELFDYVNFKNEYRNRLLEIEKTIVGYYETLTGDLRNKSNMLQKINNIESIRYKKDKKNINDELDRIDVLFYSHMEWLLKETENW